MFGNKGDKGFRKSRNLNILYRKICEKLFVLKVRVVFKKNVPMFCLQIRNLWWRWGNFSPVLLTLMRPQLTCCVKIPLVYNKSRNILAKANIYLTLRYQVKYVHSLYVLVLAIVCKQYLLISMNVNVSEGWVGLGGILCRIELCYCRSHRDLTVCWKQMHKKDRYSIKVHGLDHGLDHNQLTFKSFRKLYERYYFNLI